MVSRWWAGLVLILLLGGSASSAVAQTAASAAPGSAPESVLDDPFVKKYGTKGLDLLYNMESERAQTVFDRINERYPRHPIGPFLEGLNLWWTIMLDLTDTEHDDAFFAQMEEVIARCEALLDENPDHFDAHVLKAAAHGFQARLHSNRSNWWSAVRNGQKAINHVHVLEGDSLRGDYAFGKGMYDYYAAILPEEYPVSKAIMWMLPDGNRERGLRFLRRTAENGRYVQTEAIYFLTQIHFLYEDNFDQALRNVRRLRERHPDNPYFHNFEGRVLARWGYWGEAQDVFREVVSRAEADQAGYNVHMEEIARYYLGRGHLYQDDYDEALRHLARLEQLTDRDIEDNRFRIMGYLYQGMVYDAMGRRDIAVSRYRRVLRMDDPVEAHERAERYLEEPYSG
mgnify:CR=1 FL=1